MLTILKLIDISPFNMRFQVTQPLTIDQFRSLFFMSKTHWNKTVLCPYVSFEPKKTYTLTYKNNISKQHFTKDVLIVYEDIFCLVVYKPPFLLVHEDGNTLDTLQTRVQSYLIQKGWPHSAQAIHRIDYETSGLVLFCKLPFFQPFFDHSMQEHSIKKEYICKIRGKLSCQTIDFPIARDRHNAKKMRISKTGKPCKTQILSSSPCKEGSLLRVGIETGRKHQIRVHLSALHHPILNDPLYGKRINAQGLYLQCDKLIFPIPFQKDPICIQCPIQERFL